MKNKQNYFRILIFFSFLSFFGEKFERQKKQKRKRKQKRWYQKPLDRRKGVLLFFVFFFGDVCSDGSTVIRVPGPLNDSCSSVADMAKLSANMEKMFALLKKNQQS